jgi:hypothetical protein
MMYPTRTMYMAHNNEYYVKNKCNRKHIYNVVECLLNIKSQYVHILIFWAGFLWNFCRLRNLLLLMYLHFGSFMLCLI